VASRVRLESVNSGVVEVARLLLAATELEYEETRYPIEMEWKDGKPDFSTVKREKFEAAKAAGDLKMSGGKVPLLVVDGAEIGQSKAIERYIATIGGLRGTNAFEAAQIDQVVETINDIKAAYQKSDKADAWFKEELPKAMSAFDGTVAAGMKDGPLSYADIVVYYYFYFFCDNVEGNVAAMTAAPNVAAMAEKAKNNPLIQAYEAKRKVTPI
jgi:glutathione S-transferase